MSNFSKTRKSREDRPLWFWPGVLVFLVFVAFVAYSVGNRSGVQEGKQQMQSMVNQAKADMDAQSKKNLALVDELKVQIDKLTPSLDPKYKQPPSQNAEAYADQLVTKVEAAKTPEDRENTFWAERCAIRRDLVGAPVMAVTEGLRYDTYQQFSDQAGVYYVQLVYDKRVPLRPESSLGVLVHMQKMDMTTCQ